MIAALGSGILVAFQVGKVAVTLPVLRHELGLAVTAASMLIALVGIAGMTLGLVTGALTARVGARRIAIVGLTLTAFGGAATVVAAGAGGLLAARTAEAIGIVATEVALPSLIVAASARRNRSLAFGLWGAHMPLGQAIVILIAPTALLAFGWRALWLVNAVLLVAVMLALRGASQRNERASRVMPTDPLGDLRYMIVRIPRAPAVLFLLYTFQWTSVVGFLPTIYTDNGIPLGMAGTLTSCVVGANIVGNLAGTTLVSLGWRVGRVMALACVVMGATDVAIFSHAIPFWTEFAAALAFSGFGGLIPANLFVVTSTRASSPRQAAAANGLLLQGSWTGSAVGPLALGALVSAVGDWSASSWLLAPAAAIAAATALTLDRNNPTALEGRVDDSRSRALA